MADWPVLVPNNAIAAGRLAAPKAHISPGTTECTQKTGLRFGGAYLEAKSVSTVM